MNVYQPPLLNHNEVILYASEQILDDVIMLGDFNAHHPEWMPGRQANSRGIALKQTATARKLKQVVRLGSTTRRDARGRRDSTLDLIFYSESIDFIQYQIGRDND